MSMPGIKTVLCFLLLNPVILFAQQRIEKPNIVFIMVDDLGWGELGCYGNTFNETPHLDELAREGMRFTQAYAAAPVCSPTRASIMTAQYPARVGVTDILPGRSPRYLDSSQSLSFKQIFEAAVIRSREICKCP